MKSYPSLMLIVSLMFALLTQRAEYHGLARGVSTLFLG